MRHRDLLRKKNKKTKIDTSIKWWLKRLGEGDRERVHVRLQCYESGLCRTALSIVGLCCCVYTCSVLSASPTAVGETHPPRQRIITNKSPQSEAQINREGDASHERTHARARTE